MPSACARPTWSWPPSRTALGSATGAASTPPRTWAAWSSRWADSPPTSGSMRSSTYPITVLGCTPSYALVPGRGGGQEGHRPRQAGEDPHHVAHGRARRVHPGHAGQDRGGLRRPGFRPARLTEIAAWGFECQARSGLTHVHEDYCYPEVLDEDGRAVGPGGRGELVFTSLYRKAMPLLRYRTRDIVPACRSPLSVWADPGGLRGGVHARLDDMKKVRGIIVYPRRIEEIVRTAPGRRRIPDRLPSPPRARRDPGTGGSRPLLSPAERTGLLHAVGEDLVLASGSA